MFHCVAGIWPIRPSPPAWGRLIKDSPYVKEVSAVAQSLCNHASVVVAHMFLASVTKRLFFPALLSACTSTIRLYSVLRADQWLQSIEIHKDQEGLRQESPQTWVSRRALATVACQNRLRHVLHSMRRAHRKPWLLPVAAIYLTCGLCLIQPFHHGAFNERVCFSFGSLALLGLEFLFDLDAAARFTLQHQLA